MDLDTAASYAEIIGLVTILGAAIYSWFQIREMKASRDSAAALILSEHFHRPDWVAGVVELVYQPKDIDSLEKFKEYHGERWPDLMAVMTTWESMGALVHRGDLDFHLVYDMYSGSEGSVSSDPLQALRILICLLRVIGQTLRIHPIEYTDTTYQLD